MKEGHEPIDESIVDRVDRIGGRVFFSLWGLLIIIGVVGIGIPIFVGSVIANNSAGIAIGGSTVVGGAWMGRYLLSSKRRLSEIE